MKRRLFVLGILALAAGVLLAVAGTGSSASKSAQVLPSAACGPVFYKGPGKPQYLIASDLPLQGAGRAQNIAMGKAIQYVLDRQYHFKAGKYTIGYQSCDDSTAQAAKWDAAKCTSNGRAYAADKSVLGILGTFNSGCAKLIIPLANRAPGGPLGMLSVANTAVELTHTASWTAPGEPGVYYPTGKRNYVRVSASDDYQGPAAADLFLSKAFKLAQGKKFSPITNVYVVHDNETFGKGVANGFRQRAAKLGIKILGFEPWDAKATSYEAIGERIKGTGAKAVYFGGIVCNNGAKLIKDLRAVLGPDVVFAAPDGFTPYSATLAAGSAAREGRPRGEEVHRRLQQVPAPQEGRVAPAVRRLPGAGRADHARGDQALERYAGLGDVGALQDEGDQRDHGYLPLRQERRHRPAEDDQLRPAEGQHGRARVRSRPQGRGMS